MFRRAMNMINVHVECRCRFPSGGPDPVIIIVIIPQNEKSFVEITDVLQYLAANHATKKRDVPVTRKNPRREFVYRLERFPVPEDFPSFDNPFRVRTRPRYIIRQWREDSDL